MKKSPKKPSGSASSPKPALESANLKLLTKSGVVTESFRLTPAEHQVIESLTPEEVAALKSVYAKFSALPDAKKNPLWRAFCF